jgi:hypothetical protein
MAGGLNVQGFSWESWLMKAVSNILLVACLARVVITEIASLYDFVVKTISHIAG